LNRRAFTLIELLIVVAIIGILAAIALPNFLQAQIRSKTAHAMQELRNISSALELYRADNNDYPPNTHPLFGDATTGLLRYNITTPVAYLRNPGMRDPFVREQFIHTEPYYIYHNIAWYQGDYGANYKFIGAPFFAPLPNGQSYSYFYGAWRAASYGPDQHYQDSPIPALVYDPTNGTVSNGNIWMSKKTGFVKNIF
jgi:type II secretion system protein G